MDKKPTASERAREARERATAKQQLEEDRQLWRAVALTDLARVLALHERASKVDPAIALREARLLAEPHGAEILDRDLRARAGVGMLPVAETVAALVLLARKRCDAALKVLDVPVPKRADEAAKMAAVAWTRAGEASDLRWVASTAVNELFEVSPFLVELAGEGLDSHARFREGRLDEPLDAKGPSGALVYSVMVKRRPVRQPVHVEVHDPEQKNGRIRIEVVAGSRRTRVLRACWRAGLQELADGKQPPRPHPLLALRKDAEEAADSFLTDNLQATPESVWSTIDRLLQGSQEPGGKRSSSELAQEMGLTSRTVCFYLSLAELAPRLHEEGRAGRLGIKLASTLASIPDLEAQWQLYRLTAAVKPEAARIEAVQDLLERVGVKNLAKATPLEAAPPRRAAPTIRVVQARLAELGDDNPQVKLLHDFTAALAGDAAALRRLPTEVRKAMTPEKPAARRSLPKKDTV